VDVWEFSLQTQTWRLIWGSYSEQPIGNYGIRLIEDPSNIPPPRSAGCSFSGTKELYMFGGGNYGPTYNDLWMFNLTSSMWVWIAGTSNSEKSYGNVGIQGVFGAEYYPAPRSLCACWGKFDNRMYLFGGAFNDAYGESGNDVWAYDFDLDQWAWIKGSSTFQAVGNSVQKGLPNALNTPYSKFSAGYTALMKQKVVFICCSHNGIYFTYRTKSFIELI
jgi:hypothetical protein